MDEEKGRAEEIRTPLPSHPAPPPSVVAIQLPRLAMVAKIRVIRRTSPGGGEEVAPPEACKSQGGVSIPPQRLISSCRPT